MRPSALALPLVVVIIIITTTITTKMITVPIFITIRVEKMKKMTTTQERYEGGWTASS